MDSRGGSFQPRKEKDISVKKSDIRDEIKEKEREEQREISRKQDEEGVVVEEPEPRGRVKDRESGTGLDDKIKRGGAGKANWGVDVDDAVDEVIMDEAPEESPDTLEEAYAPPVPPKED